MSDQTERERMSQLFDRVDKREHERHELRIEVTLHGDENFFKGFTEDISEGGLFVTTHDLKPLGTKVSLVFSLPDGERSRIEVQCEVRWVREYDTGQSHIDPGMGLRFIDLYPADRERIEKFLEQKEPLFYDE